MKTCIVVATVLVAGVIYWGVAHSPNLSAISPAPASVNPIYNAGDLDAKGELVILASGDSYTTLKTDYALVMLNVGDEKNPQERYDFAAKSTGKLDSFHSLDDLMAALLDYPSLETVDFYSVCCGGPPWYGLSDDTVEKFYESMGVRGIALRSERPD